MAKRTGVRTDDDMSAASILKYFAKVPDPRMDRARLHPLTSVLVLSICAVICGADSFVSIVTPPPTALSTPRCSHGKKCTHRVWPVDARVHGVALSRGSGVGRVRTHASWVPAWPVDDVAAAPGSRGRSGSARSRARKPLTRCLMAQAGRGHRLSGRCRSQRVPAAREQQPFRLRPAVY